MIERWGSSRNWIWPKIEAKYQSGGRNQTAILMVASLRLRRGDASPNTSEAHNRAPLFWAAKMGPVEVVRVLLQHRDVDGNAQDSGSRTLVSLAAVRVYNRLVELLSVPNRLVRPSSGKGGTGYGP